MYTRSLFVPHFSCPHCDVHRLSIWVPMQQPYYAWAVVECGECGMVAAYYDMEGR